MKYIFVLFAIALTAKAITKQQRVEIIKNGVYCISETGISVREALRVKSGDYSSKDPLRNDYCACVMRRSRLFDADGNFDKDEAMRSAAIASEDMQAVSDAIDYCVEKLEQVTEENAFEYLKCYHEQNPSLDGFI